MLQLMKHHLHVVKLIPHEFSFKMLNDIVYKTHIIFSVFRRAVHYGIPQIHIFTI